jgi:hypothetical protein
MENALPIVEVTPALLDELPCCGIKNPEHEGFRCKREWLANQLQAGLRARILMTEDGRQCGYIEYLPGENAWRAVEAAGYMFIHCIWTFYKKYQHKGNAVRLVQCCIKDAKKSRMNGVVVIARKKPWLASSDLFLKCGFERVATAPPDYELLVLKFKKRAPNPHFLPSSPEQLKEYGPGLTIIRADQCSHSVRFAREIKEVAKREFHLKPNILVLQSCHQAQNAPTPYAVFSIILDGELLCDHQISKTRSRNIMKKRLQPESQRP